MVNLKGVNVNSHILIESVKKVTLSLLIVGFTMSLPVSSQASEESTYQTYWQEVVAYMKSGGRRLRKECPDKEHSSVRASNIAASFENARKSRNACVKVKFYRGIIKYGSQQDRQMARREIIDAYITAQDSYGAMNASTFYVHLYGKKNRERADVIHNIRTKIFEVAFENFAANPGYDPFWEKMVLGVHSKQNRQNPAFQYYSAGLFLRDYPKSNFKNKLKQILRVAEDNVGRHYVGPVKQYMRQKDYKAAIVRLSPIWSLDPDSIIYPGALEVSVEAFVKLSQQVKAVGQGKLIKRRLWNRPTINRRWVTTTVLEMNPGDAVDFDKEAQILMDQAAMLVDYMERTLPGHNATKKAKRLYQQAN